MRRTVINPRLSSVPQTGTRIGPWEVVSGLGRGGMAVVLSVRHHEDGRLGALKLCHAGADTAEADERFRREYRALSRLQHPNVVQVYDGGTWEGRLWYVMELVEGHDLRAEVEHWEKSGCADRWGRVRRVTTELARALHYIHSAGLVHRDLTPANVMVRPDGSILLMDFGVAKEASPPQANEDLTAHGELLGTVAWIAPEQITGEAVDARADLYSLGALVYLMATGRRPFHARTLAGYLDKHLHRVPRPPREVVPDVPADLEQVALRLLQKDPKDRYSSAAHLLQVLEGPLDAPVDLSRWPGALVGRVAESSALLSAVAACAEGIGGVVVVEGESGLGRSRLLKLALAEAPRLGLRTHLLGARGATSALEPFRPLIEALLAETGQRHPVLDALLGASGEAVSVERLAAFAALRSLIVGPSSRVIALDDADLADDASIELLEYLIRTTRAVNNQPILWLLTKATDEAENGLDELLSGVGSGVKPAVVRLPLLTPAAVEELLGTLLPLDPPVVALARRLHRDGEGNPGFIVEMVRGLVEERVITTVAGARQLRLDEMEVSRAVLPIPHSAREALVARLAQLSPSAREVVATLAVAHQELGQDALAMALSTTEGEVMAAVDELELAGLVRGRRVEAKVHLDVASVRTREVIYRELAADERISRHRGVGETLERLGRRRIHLVLDALALHFERGEVPGKAYPYLVRSATRLLDRSFVREALAAFDRAVAVEPDARERLPLDDADRQLCELLLKRGEALEHFGRWSQLDADLARASALAEELADDRLLGRAAGAAGRRARQAGDIAGAEAHFLKALQHAERASDHPTRAFVMNQLGVVRWSRGDLEAARRNWVEGLAIAEGAHDERSIGYGYNGLGMVAACRGQAADARRNFELAAAVFERVGLLAPLTWVRGNLVEVHLLTGNLRRGLELAEKTLAQARELNHVQGIVLGRASFADVLTHLGRAEQARVEARAALDFARQTNDPAECFTAIIPLMRASWALGEREEMLVLLDEALALGAEHDHEGFVGILHAWKARALARLGRIDEAKVSVGLALAAPGARWPYQEVRFDLALARTAGLFGDRAEGLRRADAAIRRAEACGYRLYVLKGHLLAASFTDDEANAARHRRVADALGKALAANLAPADAERFLSAEWLLS